MLQAACGTAPIALATYGLHAVLIIVFTTVSSIHIVLSLFQIQDHGALAPRSPQALPALHELPSVRFRYELVPTWTLFSNI